MKSNLRICHLSDTHGKHWDMEPVPECDVLAISGDISMAGREDEVRSFFKWLERQAQATYKILIAGNHDLCFDNDRNGGKRPEWLEECLTNYKKYMNSHYFLENSECIIEGVKFWGSPVTPWFHGDNWAYNKHRGADIKEIWNKIPMDTDVLITHGPPMYKLDYTVYSREYVGCEDLRQKIQEVKPLLHLFGHIHEGYGYAYDLDTHYFNNSICNLRYSMTGAPYLIETNFIDREIKIIDENHKTTG